MPDHFMTRDEFDRSLNAIVAKLVDAYDTEDMAAAARLHRDFNQLFVQYFAQQRAIRVENERPSNRGVSRE